MGCRASFATKRRLQRSRKKTSLPVIIKLLFGTINKVITLASL